MTKTNKIKIAYIDDEIDVIYGPLKDIEDKIAKMDNDNFEISIFFVEVRDEPSQEGFWEKLVENNYHGIIMDYKLVDSQIFENADIMWKKIKSQNPLFPLAIYTSHLEEVTLAEKAESIFEKGSDDQIEKMIKYLLAQINHGLNTIEALKRVNVELKRNDDISYAVIKNEEKIERQFSLFYEADFMQDDESKFKQLMNDAFDIIDKYTERNDDQ